MPALQDKPKPADWSIFLRLWDQKKLTPSVARYLLKLDFEESDRRRMQELTSKNKEGEISSRELKELDEYVRAGTLLSILQLKARRLLKQSMVGTAGA